MEMLWQNRIKETAKETLQVAKDALQAANEAGSTVRNLYITFLLLGVYIGIIIASTTDRQLLLIGPVTLPLLNVQLPILGFYIFVPWLFMLVHFDLLLQFFLLSHKLRIFARAADMLSTEEAAPLRERLISFPVVQMLANLQYDRLIQWLLVLVVWITVLILPLGLLLWAQIRFLPYHNANITWGHRAAVLLDAVTLWLFWPRLVSGQGAFGGWRKRRTLEQQGYSSVKSGAGVVLLEVVVITLALSWLVATVPGEPWEVWLLTHMPASWKSPSDRSEQSQRSAAFYPTFLLLEGKHKMLSRNLDLREQLLTANELSADVQHALRKGTAQQRKQALQKVQGLNLQGRDLRYAILARSLLPEADLRRAQLQGAALTEAQLQGAVLREAQLQGADLTGAQLQGADLWSAQLQGADLRWAQLQGAVLWEAQLQGADLWSAQLQGAGLLDAQLQGAALTGAQLQGAVLDFAQLQGANLTEAQLQGAALRGAQLQGAVLREAQLQGAALTGAQLQGAVLDFAQLQGARLSKASIGGAFFKNTCLDLADLRRLDLSAVNRKKYEILQYKLEKSINNPKIRENTLERLKKVIDQPGTLNGIASANQCLSDVPKLLPGCLTESEMVNYLKAQADYLVKQVACNAIDTAQGILRRLRTPEVTQNKEGNCLAAALLTADCEPVKTARSKLSDDDKQKLEKLAGESR